ncbi:tape measure protein [Lachnospiraceae bacterium JLR.KK008]
MSENSSAAVWADNFADALIRAVSAVDLFASAIEQIPSAAGSMANAVSNQILSVQQTSMNVAVTNINVLNQSWQQLSRTIESTEQNIDANVKVQEELNQKVEEGMSKAEKLKQAFMGFIKKYATMDHLEMAFKLSDDLTAATARLDMVNDGMQTTQELQNMVYQSAQRSRNAYQETADTVTQMGTMAGGAFSGNREMIGFVEQINKQFALANLGATDTGEAMQQITQAMSDGVLSGEQYNSILAKAPNILQSIADYMGVPEEELKSMAAEGVITAEIMKAAMFASADETNARFANMPMTFSQIGTSIRNTASQAFQPILQRLSEIANSEGFQTLVNGIVQGMVILIGIMVRGFEFIAGIAELVIEHWDQIVPVIAGVAAAILAYHAAVLIASIAQAAFNFVLLSCPLIQIVLLIGALIAGIIALAQNFSGVGHIAQSVFGVLCGWVNVAIQAVINFGLMVANIALGIGSAIGALAFNIMAAFHNAICSVKAWWYDLLATALKVIERICIGLNKLPFVEFDFSMISNAADEYEEKARTAESDKWEYKDISEAFDAGMSTFDAFEHGWAEEAYRDGSAVGDGFAERIDNILPDMSDPTSFFTADGGNGYGGYGNEGFDGYGEDWPGGFGGETGNIAGGVDEIAGNTGAMADSVEMSKEDLGYLRDIAEQEAINQFTTAEITIQQTNNNTIKRGMDLDGVVSRLDAALGEAIDMMAEGVYV